MKITSVTAVPFRAPRKRAWHAAFGTVLESEYAVVFIDTDDGLTGVGEIATVWDRRGISQADDVNRLLAPLLIGKDPLRLTELCVTIHRALGRGSNPAKAGVDIALHDLAGKILNVPVYQLLGGKLRDRVHLSFSVSMGPPEQMADEAAALVASGFRTLKLKAGLDHRADLAALELIRDRVGPDITLRIDMNAGVASPKEALRRVREYEPFRLEFVEQPVKGPDIAGMAFVRKRTSIPIMADESIWESADALAVVEAGAADLANIYVMEAGGLREARQAFGVCEAAGLPAMVGSMPEFGIGTVAQLHLGVTIPNLIEANDLCGFLYHQEDLLETPLRVADGIITVPEGPGLGVTLDRARLKRWEI
jgi:muconate cycloisomerase